MRNLIRKSNAKMFLGFLVFSALTPSSFAKGKTKKKAAATHTEEKPEEQSSQEHTSEMSRSSQTAGAHLLYTPLSDFMLSFGAHAVVNAGSSWQFGLTYLGGSVDARSKINDAGTAKVTRADLSGQAIYLDSRFFIGNSFSILFGIGQRTATISYRIEDSASQYFVDGKVDVTSIVIPIFLGNQWTWDSGFTFGCDWIGVMIPISGKSSASTTGNIGSSNVKTVNDEFATLGEDLSKSTSLTFALTSIGFVF